MNRIRMESWLLAVLLVALYGVVGRLDYDAAIAMSMELQTRIAQVTK